MKYIKVKIAVFIATLCLIVSLFFWNKTIHLKNQKIKEAEVKINLLLSHFWNSDFLVKGKFELDADNINMLNNLADQTHLGLWLGENQCGACVDFCVEQINNLPDSLKSNIVVFLKYENPRIRRVQKNRISNLVKVYSDSIEMSYEKFVSPTFAIIEPSLEITKTFYATPDLPIITEYYLKNILDSKFK